ncbi:MAG TPA: hypothetical protein VGC37_05250 [Friedmanniella sp.]
MSVAFAEPVLDRPTADVRAGRPSATPTRTAPTRTAPGRTTPRRPGPGVGPTARPRRLRFTAPAIAGTTSVARACEVEAAAVRLVARPGSWRLTDRGLAVVLVLAAALVAASVAVVGLTALRVTSESYHPSHSVAAPVLVQP